MAPPIYWMTSNKAPHGILGIKKCGQSFPSSHGGWCLVSPWSQPTAETSPKRADDLTVAAPPSGATLHYHRAQLKQPLGTLAEAKKKTLGSGGVMEQNGSFNLVPDK